MLNPSIYAGFQHFFCVLFFDTFLYNLLQFILSSYANCVKKCVVSCVEVLGDLCNNTNGTPQLIADAPLQSAQHYIYRSRDPISDSFGWHYGTHRNLAGAYADLDRERIGDKSAPESRT